MTSPDLERAAQAIEAFLSALGHPPASNPELSQTGARVAEAFHSDLLSGYRMDPAAILSDTCVASSDDLVILTSITTTAVCPHHLLPATGIAHVAYLPNGKLTGLGAIARLVQCFARRLVLQEQLSRDVAEALVEHLGAKAAGCVVDLAPMCMIARGGRQVGARAITTAFAGDATPQFRRAFLERLP